MFIILKTIIFFLLLIVEIKLAKSNSLLESISNNNDVNSPKAQAFLDKILARDSPLPDSVDWTKEYGVVFEVKDQGKSCKSGWAFATAGVLEGQETAVNTASMPVSLSPQNLIDCMNVDSCSGNVTLKQALEFIVKQKGISNFKDYLYTGKKGVCKYNEKSKAFFVDGVAVLPEGDEEKLKKVVAEFGPVAVSIDSNHLKWYSNGVYYNKNCKKDKKSLNHSVLIVGYGTEQEGGDYWLIKNSWGNWWGLGGFAKMARNKDNHCGIATLATIPTFNDDD